MSSSQKSPFAKKFWKSVRVALQIFLGCGVIWLIYLLKGSVWFRFYPVAITAVMWSLFTTSLWRTPLVEIFAKRMGEKLDPAGIVYCRRVTIAWVVFLSIHFLVTLSTVFLPFAFWAWYNGCIAYLLMGCMFVGEWIIRKKVKNGRRV